MATITIPQNCKFIAYDESESIAWQKLSGETYTFSWSSMMTYELIRYTNTSYTSPVCKIFYQKVDGESYAIGTWRALDTTKSSYSGEDFVQGFTSDDDATIINVSYKDCVNLTSFYLPSTLIDLNATDENFDTIGTFQGCTSLESVDLSSFTNISDADKAFMSCTNLTNVIIPSSIRTMNDCFNGCTSLANVSITLNNVYQMNRAFYNCTNLTGSIAINTSRTDLTYIDCFKGTTQPINLSGSTPYATLLAMAQTSTSSNIQAKNPYTYFIETPIEVLRDLNWQDMIYANNKFVANGTHFGVSSNGLDWTISSSYGTGEPIAYGNNKFVTYSLYGGGGGWLITDFKIRYSSDGINWTDGQILTGAMSLNGMSFGGGKFFTTALNHQFYYSTDAVTWQYSALPTIEGMWTTQFYGDNKFVAVANDLFESDPIEKVVVSSNGTSWSTMTLPSYGNWNSLVYLNNQYILTEIGSNIIATSPNGSTWTRIESSLDSPRWSSQQKMIYGDGLYYVYAEDLGWICSANLVTWTKSNLESSNYDMRPMIFAKNNFWQLQQNGTMVHTAPEPLKSLLLYIKTNNQWVAGTLYIKANNNWAEASRLFIKQNNTWIEI